MRLIIDTENPIKIDVDNISVDDRVSLMELLDKYHHAIMFSTKRIIKSISDLDGSEPKWMSELLKDIGKTIEVSESRVCQIHAQAIMKLRNILNENNYIIFETIFRI